MIFSRDDFRIDSFPDFLAFLIIIPFVAFVFPFLAAAYTLGFVMDVVGWLDT